MHWMLMFLSLLDLFFISIVSASDSTLLTVMSSASVTSIATTTSTASAIGPSASSGLPTGSQPSTGFSTGGKVGCALGAAVVLGLLIFWLRPKSRKTKPMGKPSGEKTDEEKADSSVVRVGSVVAGDSDKTD